MGLPLKRDTEKNDASESEDIPRVVIKEEAQEINLSVVEKLSEDISEEESENKAAEKKKINEPTETVLDIVKKALHADVLEAQKLMKENSAKKSLEIKSLQEKNAKLESQNGELTAKYRKYKNLASTLAEKNNSSSVKKLQEENNDLKLKLKNYVEDLQSEQDRQTDTGSKLAMKDLLLQKERTKFDDLERKFKKFLKVVNEKSDRMPDTFIAKVKTSLEESKISENLTDKNIVPEFTEKMNEKLKERNNPASLDSLMDQTKTKKAPATEEKKEEEISPKPPAASSLVKTPAQRNNRRNSKANSINPATSEKRPIEEAPEEAPTTPVARSVGRASIGRRTTPASANKMTASKPSELPSKLLANSSITIGKQTSKSSIDSKEANNSLSSSKASLSKLNKLKNNSLSISTSVDSSKAPAAMKTSGISVTKSGESNSLSADKDSLNKLKSSGISFSKVDGTASTKVESPKNNLSKMGGSKPSALKKLNISIGKSSGSDQETEAVSDRSLALIQPAGSSTRNVKKTARPTSSKRGPASAKRKFSKKEADEETGLGETQLALTSSAPLPLADDEALESVLGNVEGEGDVLSIALDADFMTGLESIDNFSKYGSLIDKIDYLSESASQITRDDSEKMKMLQVETSSEKLLEE